MLIGITGQTGAGKTTFCDALRALGLNVIDADKVAKEVSADSEYLKELSAHFRDILNFDGTLNRLKLGEIVFSDSEKLQLLNKIIFPYVTKKIEAVLENSSETLNFLDAPTLFESRFNTRCDLVIAVIANSLEEQISRLINRDGITREQVLKRINSQKTKEFFFENADIVVNNRNFDVIITLLKNFKNTIF